MKNFILLIITLGIAITINAQVSKTVNVTTAGTLSSLASSYFTTVTNLTVTGTINAKDFKCIHDEMTKLAVLDISAVTIKSYSGNDGTMKMNTIYPVNEIPMYSFDLKSALTTCILPNSATSIGAGAFSYSGLTFIMIGDSYISIGVDAFWGCRSLVEIYVQETNPNYTTTDGVLFNKNQTSLIQYPAGKQGTYSIPTSVTSIETGAFSLSSGLTNLTIPSSVTSIGDDAFIHCTELTSLTIPNGVTSIGKQTFYGCSKLTSLTVSNAVTSIGDYAFRDCVELIDFTIPNNIISIGSGAFQGCSKLNSVIIPTGVTSISNYAFYGCRGLSSIYVYQNTPIDLSYNNVEVFYNVSKSKCILHVPIGSKAAYQNAVQWKDFTNIVELITGLHIIGQSNIKVITDNGNLVIENAEIGNIVQIYSITGVKIKEETIVDSQISIALPTGVYVIRIGNYSDKLVIK